MRSRGALNARTNSLMRALVLAPGEGLIERLSAVADNPQLPLRMQLDACKHLAGALHGRIRLNHAAKRHLGEHFNLVTPEA